MDYPASHAQPQHLGGLTPPGEITCYYLLYKDQINALTPTSNIGLPRANYLLEMFAEITAVLSSGLLISSKRR